MVLIKTFMLDLFIDMSERMRVCVCMSVCLCICVCVCLVLIIAVIAAYKLIYVTACALNLLWFLHLYLI